LGYVKREPSEIPTEELTAIVAGFARYREGFTTKRMEALRAELTARIEAQS
jgi:hypothetical protein